MTTPRTNILLVDDRLDGLLAMEAILASENYNLVTARLGREALEHIKNYEFAVILLDVQMPEMDGFETAKRIRQYPPCQHTPIIFVTAISQDTPNVHKGYASGAVDYIFKPVDEFVLKAKIKVHVDLYNKNKQMQEQARLQMAAIVESSEDAIISKDLNGIISSWNKAAERIFGYTAQEVIGKPINLLIPHERHGEEVTIIQKIARGEPITHFDTVRQRKDGSLVDISLTISPIRNSKGIIVGASKIARDITERKRAEQELKKLTSILESRVAERTRALEEQAESLRQLAVELTEVEQRERRRLAEVLHDHLQQYLVAAKMRLEMHEKTSGSNGEKNGLKDAYYYIDKSIEASRLLTAELRPPVLYEGGLAAGLRYLGQKMEEQYQVHIHLNMDDDVEPGTDLIKVMLYQCTQELLFNAVKYAKVSEYLVTVNRLKNGHIRLTVEDQGAGFNVDEVEKRDKAGSGLFSIRERIRALSGEFEISSTPGNGAVFTITIPDKIDLPARLENLVTAPEEKVLTAKRSLAEGITVLIADDHPIIRQSIASLLMSQGFVKEVIEASNGAEALQKAKESDPEIILMDINMPVMNGIEATQILCSNDPDVKVIGLSVQPGSEMAQTMKDAGAVAYFNKGDDTSTLIESIKKFACIKV